MASVLLLHLLVLAACMRDSVTVNTSAKRNCMDKVECHEGILLPVWLPHNPPLPQQVMRAIIYFLCLLYMFLGVSIIADRFMAAIEVITSQVCMHLHPNLPAHRELCFIKSYRITGLVCTERSVHCTAYVTSTPCW